MKTACADIWGLGAPTLAFPALQPAGAVQISFAGRTPRPKPDEALAALAVLLHHASPEVCLCTCGWRLIVCVSMYSAFFLCMGKSQAGDAGSISLQVRHC